MTNRDSKGRFTRGNTIARQGWQGLVTKQFKGNEELAKQWFARLGMYAYGTFYRNADGTYPRWVKHCFRNHPGKPGEYCAAFTSNDTGDVNFYA